MSVTDPAPPGLFISFEGIDGAGKSTHIDALARAFEQAGRTVTRSREPGGTPLAETLRHLVLTEPMDPLTEALLVFAARREHVLGVIVPALERGDVVLCDRFADASFAYQGSGRDFPWAVLETLEHWALAGLAERVAGHPAATTTAALTEPAGRPLLQPHLTLWFDVPPALAAQRLAQARSPDRFEAQPAAFFEQVRQGYLRRAQSSPGRFVRVDGTPPADVVWKSVVLAVQERGWL